MNYLALKTKNPEAIYQVYNTAVGDRITIREMAEFIREGLSKFRPETLDIPIQYGPERSGDIPHSQASIEKANRFLNYKPSHHFKQGLEASLVWYYKNLSHA